MVKNIILILFLSIGFIGQSQSKKTTKCAQSFVNGLEKRSYKKNYKQLADTMTNLISYKEFKGMMERIILSNGEIISKELVSKQKVEENSIFSYKLIYSKKNPLIMRLSYDGENNVIGMFFRAANRKVGYVEPSVYGKSSLRERELSLSTPHGNLKSILTLPDNNGNNPVVILVHGSGPNDMDETVGNNKMFYDLTLGLVDSGIGTFRYNKRTRTYGNKFSDSSTLYSEVIEDVLEAVRLLKQQKGVDTNRIYVLGHSLGGMSAPLIAKYQNDLAGIIMMGSPCRGLWESMPMQYRYLKENTSQPITEEMIAGAEAASNKIAKGEFSDSTDKRELYGLSSRYWEYLRNYDVSTTCKGLDLPILILQGERDYQVNMDDFNCFKEKLSANKNIRLTVISGANHLFVYGKAKSIPAEYEKSGNVDLMAIQEITNWIKEGI